jgi:hypothetical protein
MFYTELWTIMKTSAMICAPAWLPPNRPRDTGTPVAVKEPVEPVETGCIDAAALGRLDWSRLGFIIGSAIVADLHELAL